MHSRAMHVYPCIPSTANNVVICNTTCTCDDVIMMSLSQGWVRATVRGIVETTSKEAQYKQQLLYIKVR